MSSNQNNAQAIHRERMHTLGTLTAGIAHELNNPIGYISSNLNTMRRYITAMERLINHADATIDPDHRAAWETLLATERWSTVKADLADVIAETRQGTEHLKHVVGDLKTLARTSVTTEQASLDDCIDSALTVLSHVLRNRCKIEKHLQANNGLLMVRSHILQLIINLVHNACDAVAKTDGKIIITSQQNDETCTMIIEDNGPGIPTEKRQDIFKEFYTTKRLGTGLGLALSNTIAEQHGGKVTCDESPTLKGARFTVTLSGVSGSRAS